MSEKDRKTVTGEYRGTDHSGEYRGSTDSGDSRSHFSHGSYHTTTTNRLSPDPGSKKPKKDDE